MDIPRKLGILVVFGVPAIIGGGVVYALFGSYTAMAVYETLLVITAGGLVSSR
jgi:zinc transporter ZupT